MKKLLSLFLSLLLATSLPLVAAENTLQQGNKESNALYSTGAGCEDAVYTATSNAMVYWGFGLAAGIALLAGLLHQSRGSSAH